MINTLIDFYTSYPIVSVVVLLVMYKTLTSYLTNTSTYSSNEQSSASNLINVKSSINSFFTLFQGLSIFSRWTKTRTSYSTDSWIYTTNHKRIAVNYFNFVLVAGTAGMSLATVIRLEFAYPGVGVLAGDSLQYLSIATAHGVIMVFFMIMPAIFGAFGNFLLPTQLGVHDVAFPRLNSAAFWFLPGALIMLCQLVCVDRRYQRMNAFSIRELQGILKRRFFNDLVNQNDVHEFLQQTLISLRFKNNGNLAATSDMSAIYNFGTTINAKTQNTTFENLYSLWNSATIFDPSERYFTDFIKWLDTMTLWNILNRVSYSLSNLMVMFKESLYLPSYLFFDLSQLLTLPKTLFNSLNDIVSLNLNWNISKKIAFFQENNSWEKMNKVLFSSENINSSAQNDEVQMSELTNNIRFTRFNNPLISYDYKCGNYIGSWEQLYPALMTYIAVARNIRKAPDFSDQFSELLKNNLNNFNIRFTTQMNLKLVM